GCAAVSIRVNATPAAAAFAFLVTSTRPAPVPAHIVSLSRPRVSELIVLPAFVAPKPAPVSVDAPSGDQSFADPHAPVNSRSLGNSPTAVLQWASRNARS